MRFKTTLALCLMVMGVGACKDDSGATGPGGVEPAALIRFVNAAVDTGTVDFRFIDRVENLPSLLGVPFRGTSGVYQRVAPGTRPVRIFVNSTDPVEAQKRLIDTTITLQADTRYTLVYAGQARGNQDRLAVLVEPSTLPAPASGNVAIRALHAEFGRGNADVTITPSNGTGTTATIANVAYLALSNYVTVPVRTAGASDSLYTFTVANAGSGTAAYSATPNQPGAAAPAGASYGPQPGVRISGSVLTALLVAGATPGSRAATASNQTPTVILLIDKVLNP